jgi:hypothetical protein
VRIALDYLGMELTRYSSHKGSPAFLAKLELLIRAPFHCRCAMLILEQALQVYRMSDLQPFCHVDTNLTNARKEIKMSIRILICKIEADSTHGSKALKISSPLQSMGVIADFDERPQGIQDRFLSAYLNITS